MSRLIQDDKKGEIELVAKLSDDLASLLFSESYSDVTFIVDNEKIPCKLFEHRKKYAQKNNTQNIIWILQCFRSQSYISG